MSGVVKDLFAGAGGPAWLMIAVLVVVVVVCGVPRLVRASTIWTSAGLQRQQNKSVRQSMTANATPAARACARENAEWVGKLIRDHPPPDG